MIRIQKQYNCNNDVCAKEFSLSLSLSLSSCNGEETLRNYTTSGYYCNKPSSWSLMSGQPFDSVSQTYYVSIDNILI
jgi:hypothetical protein